MNTSTATTVWGPHSGLQGSCANDHSHDCVISGETEEPLYSYPCVTDGFYTPVL